MSPGAAIANALAPIGGELLLVMGALGGLYGLILLYWFIRRQVIPMAVPGAVFRTVAYRIAGRVVLRKVMK